MAYIGNQLCGLEEMWSEEIRKYPILRISLVGSRDWVDYNTFRNYVISVLKKIKCKYRVVFNSGRAKGADRLGERFAKEFGFLCTYFIPYWKEQGRAAGHIRNALMAAETKITIAFWDGQSPGTKGMIKLCKSKGIFTIIKRLDDG